MVKVTTFMSMNFLANYSTQILENNFFVLITFWIKLMNTLKLLIS